MVSLMFEHDTVISQQGIKYGFSLDSWGFLFYIWRLDLSPCFEVCGIFFFLSLWVFADFVQLCSAEECK